MKYFEVTVLIKNEVDSKQGVKIQKVKEKYLVDAMTITEAEARTIKLFEKSGFSQDYDIIAVNASKIAEVISPEINVKEGRWKPLTKKEESQDLEKEWEEVSNKPE